MATKARPCSAAAIVPVAEDTGPRGGRGEELGEGEGSSLVTGKFASASRRCVISWMGCPQIPKMTTTRHLRATGEQGKVMMMRSEAMMVRAGQISSFNSPPAMSQTRICMPKFMIGVMGRTRQSAPRLRRQMVATRTATKPPLFQTNYLTMRPMMRQRSKKSQVQ